MSRIEVLRTPRSALPFGSYDTTIVIKKSRLDHGSEHGSAGSKTLTPWDTIPIRRFSKKEKSKPPQQQARWEIGIREDSEIDSPSGFSYVRSVYMNDRYTSAFLPPSLVIVDRADLGDFVLLSEFRERGGLFLCEFLLPRLTECTKLLVI